MKLNRFKLSKCNDLLEKHGILKAREYFCDHFKILDDGCYIRLYDLKIFEHDIFVRVYLNRLPSFSDWFLTEHDHIYTLIDDETKARIDEDEYTINMSPIVNRKKQGRPKTTTKNLFIKNTQKATKKVTKKKKKDKDENMSDKSNYYMSDTDASDASSLLLSDTIHYKGTTYNIQDKFDYDLSD